MRRLEPDGFQAISTALYGDGAWEVAKAHGLGGSGDPVKQRREARIGLASTASGIASAGLATGHALRDPRLQGAGKVGRKIYAAGGKIPKPITNFVAHKPKTAAALGLGALALHGANMVGDTFATKTLARASFKPLPKQRKQVSKQESFVLSATVSKAVEDKRQVYGWASITEINGEPVVDLQGDYVTIEEIERAAYEYVSKSRKGGDMHRREGEAPVHVADLIESVVITPEKKEALGLPEDSPTGWWVGFQVSDDATWNLVKSGQRPMFSIHGMGKRVETEI